MHTEKTLNEVLDNEMSPLKKIKKLFKNNTTRNYEINPGIG